MTIDQLTDNIKSVTSKDGGSAMIKIFENIVINNIIANVQRRIQKTGMLASGQKPKYSTKPSLIGYPSANMLSNYSAMYKKAYNQLKSEDKKISKSFKKAKKVLSKGTYSGLERESKWVKVKDASGNYHSLIKNPFGYKWVREVGGYQTGYVDLTISNSMWRAVKIVSTVATGNNVTVTYGTNIEAEAEKIEGHNIRYGENILLYTTEEMNMAKEVLKKDLINYLSEKLFK